MAEDRKTFRFLDLPRELRNAIYAELAQEGNNMPAMPPCDAHPEQDYSLALKGWLPMNLRLVCKRFRQECSEETSRSLELTMKALLGSYLNPIIFVEPLPRSSFTGV